MIGKRYFSGSAFEDKVGYARAVIDGEMIYVSGTTGFDPDTQQYPEDVESQCENCFKTIAVALADNAASLNDLLQVRVFVASREEFTRIMPIVKKYCDHARPTNTTVLAELIEPQMRVEIEVTARRSTP
jgi:enamine deaminase RidA (YjgF/YER057c/UK114 family)